MFSFNCVDTLWQILTFVISSAAYQLRTCQPPPPVANATTLTDDDQFEIGLSYFILLVYEPGAMHNTINLPQSEHKLPGQLGQSTK